MFHKFSPPVERKISTLNLFRMVYCTGGAHSLHMAADSSVIFPANMYVGTQKAVLAFS